jgi:hypothetical protein
MRILLVVHAIAPRYGGLAVMGPELASELVRQGHDVSIYTSDVDGPERLNVPVDRPVISNGRCRGRTWSRRHFGARFVKKWRPSISCIVGQYTVFRRL